MTDDEPLRPYPVVAVTFTAGSHVDLLDPQVARDTRVPAGPGQRRGGLGVRMAQLLGVDVVPTTAGQVRPVDRGGEPAVNRAYLTRGGGHYIHAEKLRHTNTEAAAALARPGRYASVAGNLRVKEIHVAPGGKGDGDDGVRAQRFVVCHNPEQGERDAVVRSNLIAHLQHLIDGSDAWTARKRDELVGSLKTKPGLRRYLRRTKAGLLRIDHGAAKR